jgi:hypothetical protein
MLQTFAVDTFSNGRPNPRIRGRFGSLADLMPSTDSSLGIAQLSRLIERRANKRPVRKSAGCMNYCSRSHFSMQFPDAVCLWHAPLVARRLTTRTLWSLCLGLPFGRARQGKFLSWFRLGPPRPPKLDGVRSGPGLNLGYPGVV